jgi:GMP synthase-like glutamine amidotransferase
MILIVDMNSSELASKEFVSPILRIVGKENCKVVRYTHVSSSMLGMYDRIILSGTTLRDMEFANNPESFSWIRDCRVPVLGICAGMQAIGMAFGSKLERCQEIGMVKIETVKNNALFSDKFSAYALHSFAMQSSKIFDLLAKSEKCTHAIKHKERDIYGVLFHPEVRNNQIIENFMKIG